ncbi:MAG: O-antigen ligase family protein [Candidatus Komeilibacteria bacterium]|nr:O-antigen ligase family protein [Candidatus Komeilibacteria bacterium]
MFNNLFGKTFRITFLSIFIAEVISFLVQGVVQLNNLFFLLIAGAVLILSLFKLEYGLYALWAELLISSKGYLFYFTLAGQRISLRIGLFVVILSVWLWRFVFKKDRKFFIGNQWLNGYLFLAAVIILGLTAGLLNNRLSNVFLDANAWLFFLMAPVWFSALASEKIIRNILAILLSAAGYLSVQTLALAALFSRQLPPVSAPLYQWIRSSGLGEITPLGDGFYRIFFQSQIYLLVALFLTLALLILTKPKKGERVWLSAVAALSSTALLASLSRSFWLGLIAGILFLLIMGAIKFKLSFKYLTGIILILISAFVLELGFLSLLAGNYYPKVLFGRLTNPTEEAAGSSRLQQFKPLIKSISQHWLLGAGFGKTVTYISNDPRVREKSPSGLYTAYAFELGYLDIWLKLGVLGLLAYLYLIAKIVQASLKLGVLGISLILGLIAIAVTSVFSPYLNHPLGIGFIILSTAIINYLPKNEQ